MRMRLVRVAAAPLPPAMPPAMPPKVKKAPRPVREAAASALYSSADASAWAASLAAAPARAAATGVNHEGRFYGLRLEGTAGAHPIAAIKKADVVMTVAWKLSRGMWRPRLLAFAEALTEAEVKDAAAAAAAALGNGPAPPAEAALAAAIAALAELKGIGPATATALLTAADDSIPFLSDEAGVAACGCREYTTPAALALTAALRAKADALGPPWTPRDVERALWSASRAPEVEGDGGGGEEAKGSSGGSKKRKTRGKAGLKQ